MHNDFLHEEISKNIPAKPLFRVEILLPLSPADLFQVVINSNILYSVFTSAKWIIAVRSLALNET